MILCDFFPLYNFQSDVCAPASESIKNKHRPTDDEKDPTLIDDGISRNRTALYGFRARRRPAMTELVLATWIFTLLCEEIRQVVLTSTACQSFR